MALPYGNYKIKNFIKLTKRSFFMSSANVTRRSKGEQTRQKILEAAIEVIAQSGIKGTTHRAVAQQANIQLSLTTYYFVDIKELITEAITMSCERYLANGQDALNELISAITFYDAATLRKASTKQVLCEKLSQIIAGYVYDNIINQRTSMAVQQVFLTERLYIPKLKELAQKHVEITEERFYKFCSFFNKIDPEIDAELTMIVITRIESRYINTPVEQIDKDLILRLVRRQFGFVLGLKKQ